MTKVFIDGSAGTTGLRIRDRLSLRKDIVILSLPEELRKNENARREMINSADVVFLCLPDAAAVEAVGLCENENTRVIDTSTAHRVKDGWEYGFPELTGRRARIAESRRIANPGCHAGGFIALVAPLVENKIIPGDAFLSCFSVTGYSGGGKKMIAEYEDAGRDGLLDAPRLYGLSQSHKHLPEMRIISGLAKDPAFMPVVAPFYSGMEVVVPLSRDAIRGTAADIGSVYADYYTEGTVRYVPEADEGGFMSAASLSGKDSMEITVAGNEERILLVSRFDNLGKGASGAAIQNMNVALGIPEETGLVL